MQQSEFMRRMMRLEYALYARDSSYDKKDGFPGLVAHLVQTGKLQEEDAEALRTLWSIRNDVAGAPPHGTSLPYHVEALFTQAEAIATSV